MSHRLRAALVLTLVVAVPGLLGACKADTDEGQQTDDADVSLLPAQSTVDETTAPATVTSTAPTTPTTAAPSAPTAFAPSAREAIDGVRAAWEAGDQATARTLAPGDVVDQLFAVPADGFETYGCDTGEFATSTCNLRNRSTEAFIVVTAARSDAGWQIASIDVNLD